MNDKDKQSIRDGRCIFNESTLRLILNTAYVRPQSYQTSEDFYERYYKRQLLITSVRQFQKFGVEVNTSNRNNIVHNK
jgi:hypothetical protein